MLGKKRLILHKNNIYYIIYDYFYTDWYPETYYLYLPLRNGLKFTLVKKTDKYAIYEWL